MPFRFISRLPPLRPRLRAPQAGHNTRAPLLACVLWATGAAAGDVPLQTHGEGDLQRYAGTWYEIAKLPNRFQRECARDARAEYESLEEGRIRVVNRCRDASGAPLEAEGTARVVDPASNSKLEVSFVKLFGWHLFWGDYWILDVGKDYDYAVVGVPSRRYGWILARDPNLSPATRSRIDQVLVRAGYDPDAFVETPHGRP